MTLFGFTRKARGCSARANSLRPFDRPRHICRGRVLASKCTSRFARSDNIYERQDGVSYAPNRALDGHLASVLTGLVRAARRLVFGLLALLAPVGIVSAADMPVEPQVVLRGTYVPDPVYNWTGVYIGASAGYGWANADWGNLGGIYSAKGGMFGGQIGYNWQFGQFVYSLEGGVDLTDLQDTINVLGCTARVCSAKNMLLSTMPTVRTRVGMTFGRWMPYLAVGMAVGDIRTNTFGNIRRNTFGLEEINQTSAGWTVGAGVEVALINNWSARLEYVYADFGSMKCVLYCGLAGTTFDFTMSALRGGVNYRF
jgi:outer membrane immunogenic protein